MPTPLPAGTGATVNEAPVPESSASTTSSRHAPSTQAQRPADLSAPSAFPSSLRALTIADLPSVMPIERAAYAFPWSQGNFVDSLAAGYLALASTEGDALVAYCVALHGVDETHLLNLTTASRFAGRGHGRGLLAAVVEHARRRGDERLWLEVRESNARARAVYERFGFETGGRRKGYYPASGGFREDAVVMLMPLQGEGRRRAVD